MIYDAASVNWSLCSGNFVPAFQKLFSDCEKKIDEKGNTPPYFTTCKYGVTFSILQYRTNFVNLSQYKKIKSQRKSCVKVESGFLTFFSFIRNKNHTKNITFLVTLFLATGNEY